MKRLRSTTLALLIGMALFFNIERLDFQVENAVNISSFVYVLGFLSVLSVIAIPILWRSHVAVPILIWITIYTVYKLFLFNTDGGIEGGINPYLYITELTVPSVLIWLAHGFSRAVRDFEKTVEDITLAGLSRPLEFVDEASESIQKEMKLSRRNRRPLSIIVVEYEPESVEVRLNRALEEVQRAIIARHSLISLSKVLDRLLRCSDMMLEQRGRGRVVVVCPETNRQNSFALAHRIREAADKLGLTVSCGTACLPDDALTFDELLSQAESNLHHPRLSAYTSAEAQKNAAGE